MQDYNDLWKFPPEKDGWARAHNAIRRNMSEINRLLSAYVSQLQAGQPLSTAQITAAKAYWNMFEKFVHHHHDNEEKYAMPYISQRTPLPSRVADDHVNLMNALDHLSELLLKTLDSAVETGAALKSMIGIKDKFAKLEHDMLDHFHEEETVCLPLMRKHITPSECQKHIVTPIVRSMSALDNGNYFDPIVDANEMSEFARQEGIPFFIVWILKMHVRKYRRNVKHPFEKAVAEAEAVIPPAIAA